MQVRLLTSDEPLELGDARLGLRQLSAGRAAAATASGEDDGADAARAARVPLPPDLWPSLAIETRRAMGAIGFRATRKETCEERQPLSINRKPARRFPSGEPRLPSPASTKVIS